MEKFKSVVLAAILGFWSQAVLGHGNVETRIVLETEINTVTAGLNTIKFKIHDSEAHQMIGDSDLAISHEKKLHLIIYDFSLNEFQHIHPEFDGADWKASVQLNVDGNYWMWAQGELVSDGTEFSSPTKISVIGGRPAWPLPPALVDTRSGASGLSQINLSLNRLRAGRMAMLDLKMSRTDGSTVQLTPYLGAFAHVIATADDGDSLIHVHPEGKGPAQGMLHVTFPSAGLYRLWVQFIDGGILKTIPISVQVF